MSTNGGDSEDRVRGSTVCSHQEGYLLKRGYKVKNWKRRFFVVRNQSLYYYKTNRKVCVCVCAFVGAFAVCFVACLSHVCACVLACVAHFDGITTANTQHNSPQYISQHQLHTNTHTHQHTTHTRAHTRKVGMPLGQIELEGSHITPFAPNHFNKMYSFGVSPANKDRTYVFVALSNQERGMYY